MEGMKSMAMNQEEVSIGKRQPYYNSLTLNDKDFTELADMKTGDKVIMMIEMHKTGENKAGKNMEHRLEMHMGKMMSEKKEEKE